MQRCWVVAMAALACVASAALAEQPPAAQLSGKITDVSAPDAVWLGPIEVRLRGAFVLDDQRETGLEFMRALANGREVECELTGERIARADGPLVGHCLIFGPTDGREIDLAARLIERGFARPCEEPAAVIAIWPPVYGCL